MWPSFWQLKEEYVEQFENHYNTEQLKDVV